MKYCSCRHCDAGFEFTGAIKDMLGWHTRCPSCGGNIDIDIEDYVVQRGTLVGLHTGTKGVVTTFNDEYAEEFGEIVYLVTYHIGDLEQTTRIRRDDFDLIENWKLLKRTEFGIERVCHYPANQEWSNAPCYNCADRVKCNDDILNRLAQYEDTGLMPEKVAAYQKIEAALAQIGLDKELLRRYMAIHSREITASHLLELEQAEREGRMMAHIPGDVVRDQFGIEWIVTSAEIHLIDGKLRYLYRCGHPGTNDYCALFAEELGL